MGLQKQTIAIPFAQGVDTKTADYHVQPGKLLACENARITRSGMLEKRYGYTAMTDTSITGASIGTVYSLAKLDDQLLTVAGNGVYSYSNDPDGWVAESGNERDYPETTRFVIDQREINSQIYHPDETILHLDCAVMQSLCVTAWIDSSNQVRVSVFDTDTNTYYMQGATTGTNVQKVRLTKFYSGADFMVLVVYAQDASSPYTISCRPINLSDTPQTLGTEYDIVTDLDEPDAWDLIDNNLSYTSDPVLVYQDDGLDIDLVSFDDTAVTNGPVIFNALGATVSKISICAGGPSYTYVLVVYSDGTDISGGSVLRSNLLTAGFAQKTIKATVDPNVLGLTWGADTGASSQWNVVYEEESATLDLKTKINHVSVSSTGTVVWSPSYNFISAMGYGMASKPYGRYLVVRCLTNEQPHYLLINYLDEMGSGNVMAKFLVGKGPLFGDYDYSALNLVLQSSITTDDSGYMYLAVITTESFGADTSTSNLGVRLIKIDTTHAPQYTKFGKSMLQTGGLPMLYDGANASELGFMTYPEGVSLTTAGTGGSLTDGAYSVRVLYAHYDSNNERHVSAPSTAATITLSGGTSTQTIVVATPRLHMTYKDAYAMEIYCTEVNGTTHYQVASVGFNIENAAAITASEIYSYTVTSIDTGNKILYTEGGVIENIQPGYLKSIVSRQDRAIAICEDNQIWYSKPFVSGEGAAFSDLLVLNADPRLGTAQRLAVQDGRLIIFNSSGISYLDGYGPNNLGQGSFATIRDITTALGILENAPVATADPGTFFVSPRGIELLDRNLSVVFVGAPVQNVSTGTIRSAVVLPDQDEVRFGSNNADDQILVYNHYQNQWMVHTGLDGDIAIYWDGSYVLADSDDFYKQDKTTFTDRGTSYVFLTDTSWFKVAGVQGVQRIYWVSLIGDYRSDHTFTIDVYYDYSETSAQTITKTITSDLDPQQFRFKPVRQKCESIRFRIQDASPSGTEESFSLSHIQLTVGVKGGIKRLGATQSG